MMPQTVPNRPTNGAVEPMVASTPVPRDMRRAAADSMRDKREATRSLSPSPEACPSAAADSATSSAAACTSIATAPARPVERGCSLAQRRRPADRRQCLARTQPRASELDRLDQPHRPGDQRCEGEPQHHRFHHDVGSHEHAHRRQVLRQVQRRCRARRRGDRGLRCRVRGGRPRQARSNRRGRLLRRDGSRRARNSRWSGRGSCRQPACPARRHGSRTTGSMQ